MEPWWPSVPTVSSPDIGDLIMYASGIKKDPACYHLIDTFHEHILINRRSEKMCSSPAIQAQCCGTCRLRSDQPWELWSVRQTWCQYISSHHDINRRKCFKAFNILVFILFAVISSGFQKTINIKWFQVIIGLVNQVTCTGDHNAISDSRAP